VTYAVKEIFYTLQGEGANTGMPAVFCRFAGCNLWSGREKDRPDAVCRFAAVRHGLISLARRARHAAVTAEHAAITGLGFEPSPTFIAA
jgi:organic radical activating enzyme